jgi:putative Mg2+ transporter-C (MgtC) family protein
MAMTLTLLFAGRMTAALLLGAAVGLERQWRQRTAGTRTNALVAAGASAFVMAGLLIDGDASAIGRIAAYVVSGVGFLGAGVIFKESGNVHGLNTAATIWCSAAIGILSGLGAPHLSLILAAAVIFTNTVLRPLAYRLHPIRPEPVPILISYELNLTCRCSDEVHIRTLLLSTISQSPATLEAIHSESSENSASMRIRAEVNTLGKRNEVLEQVVARLSLEPGISDVSWSVLPAILD